MSEVGTRRNARLLAGALVAEDWFGRQVMNTTPQVTYGADISLVAPPFGFDAPLIAIAAAVPARWAGFVVMTPREDGIWLQEAVAFSNTYWNMFWGANPYPTPPASFTTLANPTTEACSYDYGWEETGLSSVTVVSGSFAAAFAAGGPGTFAFTTSGIGVATRCGGPIWIPPNSYFQCSHDTVNTAMTCQFRFRWGGPR